MTGGGQPRTPEHRPRAALPWALCIGASTGGPRALLTLVAELALPASVYAFLVQHIHPKFTHILVRRLNEVAAFPVLEAAHGGTVEPGRLYLAPAGQHLVVERRWPRTFRTLLSTDPPRHGVRPAVDVLFGSAAAAFGRGAVGVVLTGMGRDGLDGARAIKERSGTVLAEAEATCIVYGMPRALAESGLADRMVPIGEMAAAIHEVWAESADRRARPLSPSVE